MVAAIRKSAEDCADAQLKMDFNRFIPYLPAKLLEYMGGAEGLSRTMTEGTAQMKANNITMESAKIGTPEVPKEHEGVLAGLVPMQIVMSTPQGKLLTKSHLIAISENKGKTWVFIDCASMTDEKIGLLYPSLAGKIDFPKAETKLVE